MICILLYSTFIKCTVYTEIVAYKCVIVFVVSNFLCLVLMVCVFVFHVFTLQPVGLGLQFVSLSTAAACQCYLSFNVLLTVLM